MVLTKTPSSLHLWRQHRRKPNGLQTDRSVISGWYLHPVWRDAAYVFPVHVDSSVIFIVCERNFYTIDESRANSYQCKWPKKQTKQLWIKKVDANPCRGEFLWSNNRTSNRNLARTKKRKLLQYYYRRWHKLAVIKQMPLHISLNPSTVTPPFPFDNLKQMKEGQKEWTR